MAALHMHSRKDQDAAAALVELLKPGAWIPSAHARWLPVVEALLEAFLRHFEPEVLARLLDDQRALPPSASAGVRAARMARGIDRFAQNMSDVWRGMHAFQRRLAQHSRP